MVGSEIINQPTRIKLPSCIPGTAHDFHETATYDRYLRMKQAALGGEFAIPVAGIGSHASKSRNHLIRIRISFRRRNPGVHGGS